MNELGSRFGAGIDLASFDGSTLIPLVLVRQEDW